MRWRLCLWKQKTCCLEKQNPRIGSPCTAMSGPGQRSPGLCSGGLPLAQQMPKREWSEPSPGKRTMTHTWSTKSPAARQSGSPGWRKSPPISIRMPASPLARNTWGKGMESKSCDFSWNIAPAQWAARNSTTPPKPSTKPPAPWLSPVASRTTTPSKGSIYKAESLTSWKTVGQTNHLFLPSPREIGNTAGRI